MGKGARVLDIRKKIANKPLVKPSKPNNNNNNKITLKPNLKVQPPFATFYSPILQTLRNNKISQTSQTTHCTLSSSTSQNAKPFHLHLGQKKKFNTTLISESCFLVTFYVHV
jgi:hypothetical protein